MSERVYSQRVHYCPRCGATFRRSTEEDIRYVCGSCNTWPMHHAEVRWREIIPDPDPLEALLVGETP